MTVSDRQNAPFLRQSESASVRCWDVLIPLLPLTVYSCVYYGWRPLFVMLISVAAAMAAEVIGYGLQMRRAPLLDGTAAVTGGIIGLFMSPIVPYWVPVIASAFAIWLIKLPFGGRGHNIFNPAAGGLAFVTVCFSAQMFTYPDPEQSIADLGAVVTKASPASLLQAGATPDYGTMDIALSNFPSPIGSVLIILFACILYLFVRRASSPWIVLPFLGVCTAWAILFPRASGGILNSIWLELCAGHLMLTATFLIADPVTAPRHWLARLCYGVLAGLLVMAIRYFGKYEEGAVFAVLIVNLFSSALDRWCWQFCRLFEKRKGGEAA